MFKEYGFQIPAEELAVTADEAVRLAGEIGFPVVMKISSPDILHKTDIGGVLIKLRTVDEVRQGFHHILSAAQAAQPQARIEGVQIQEMVRAESRSSSACLMTPSLAR